MCTVGDVAFLSRKVVHICVAKQKCDSAIHIILRYALVLCTLHYEDLFKLAPTKPLEQVLKRTYRFYIFGLINDQLEILKALLPHISNYHAFS